MKFLGFAARLMALSSVLLGQGAQAADVAFYSITKGLKYNQGDAGAPVLANNGYRFAADAAPSSANSITTATIATTGVSPQPLTVDAATTWLSIGAKGTTQAQLDSQAPDGKYTFVFNTAHDGQRTVSLTIAAPQYPAAPHLNNFQAAQAIDPSKPFTLTWDALTGGTAQDYLLLLLGDAVTGTAIYRSPAPFQPGALNGTATSLILPAGTLQPNKQYLFEINFVKIKSIDQTSYPGSFGVVGFNSYTDVTITTTAAAVTPPQFKIFFRQFAQGGRFLGGTNSVQTIPTPLNGYRAQLTVSNDSNFPPAAQVFITGPAGSGLVNTAADTAASSIGTTTATYFSPRVGPPPTAPGGTWTVNYRGVNYPISIADPQLSADLAIPLPKVTVVSDVLKEVNWSFANSSGAPLSGVPAFLSGLHVQASDASGAFILDSGVLPNASLSYTLTSPLAWSAVNTLRFMYNDNRGNSYVLGFPKVAVNPFSLTASKRPTSSGFSLQLSGDTGLDYLVRFSPDLLHWTDLMITNLTSPKITLTDPGAGTAPARFYRAELAN